MDMMLFVLVVVILGAVSDAARGLIPNWLTMAGVSGGITLQTAHDGLSGLVGSLAGYCVGIALLIGFYACGGMGAGDVKLLGAVGSCLGPFGVMHAALATAVLGGIYALALGCRRWGMLATYRYIVTGCLTVLLTSRAFPGAISDSSSPLVLRYGVAIALGTTLSLWWRGQ
jgi:prepilin peptidase CpaA